MVHNNILASDRISIQRFDVTGVGIGKGINLFESPKNGVTSPSPLAVFILYTGDTDRLPVNGDERGGGVAKIEGVSELYVFRAVSLARGGTDRWEDLGCIRLIRSSQDVGP